MGPGSSSKRPRPSKALLASAIAGSAESIGQVLESCRTYLMLIAQEELDRDLRAKIGPSDLVQETFVAAQQVFDRFRGDSADELFAWLRGILLNKISEAHRYHRAKQRAVDREIPLDGGPSSARLARQRPVKANTPSRQLAASEQAEHISRALSNLSRDHQQVIQLRNWKAMPFEEIGRRMNRSAGAARALWIRALNELAQALDHD